MWTKEKVTAVDKMLRESRPPVNAKTPSEPPQPPKPEQQPQPKVPPATMAQLQAMAEQMIQKKHKAMADQLQRQQAAMLIQKKQGTPAPQFGINTPNKQEIELQARMNELKRKKKQEKKKKNKKKKKRERKKREKERERERQALKVMQRRLDYEQSRHLSFMENQLDRSQRER